MRREVPSALWARDGGGDSERYRLFCAEEHSVEPLEDGVSPGEVPLLPFSLKVVGLRALGAQQPDFWRKIVGILQCSVGGAAVAKTEAPKLKAVMKPSFRRRLGSVSRVLPR